MFVIGLTGNVAAGKSLVSRELAALGAVVLDADAIGHEVIEPGRPAYREIVDHFGEGVLKPDGSVDRKQLGRIVFGDSRELKNLNRITHPRIAEETARRLARLEQDQPDAVAVLEAALLVEIGLDRLSDEIWLVVADEESQIKRLKEREGYEREESLRRIRAQAPQEEKIPLADKIIRNSGNVDIIRRRVLALWSEKFS